MYQTNPVRVHCITSNEVVKAMYIKLLEVTGGKERLMHYITTYKP